MTPTFQELGPCPCFTCDKVGTKLAKRSGHLVGCTCRSCLGRRNRERGRKAQGRGYRRLGGDAKFTPGHEENQGVLSIEVGVESKQGQQIPASLLSFARGVWARRAWSQAERAIPEGVQADPAIYIESEGWQLLVVKLKEGRP